MWSASFACAPFISDLLSITQPTLGKQEHSPERGALYGHPKLKSSIESRTQALTGIQPGLQMYASHWPWQYVHVSAPLVWSSHHMMRNWCYFLHRVTTSIKCQLRSKYWTDVSFLLFHSFEILLDFPTSAMPGWASTFLFCSVNLPTYPVPSTLPWCLDVLSSPPASRGLWRGPWKVSVAPLHCIASVPWCSGAFLECGAFCLGRSHPPAHSPQDLSKASPCHSSCPLPLPAGMYPSILLRKLRSFIVPHILPSFCHFIQVVLPYLSGSTCHLPGPQSLLLLVTAASPLPMEGILQGPSWDAGPSHPSIPSCYPFSILEIPTSLNCLRWLLPGLLFPFVNELLNVTI